MFCAEPKISVIIAVFNGAERLLGALDSVRTQTYPHKELIVIDGGSTDGSVEVIKAHQDIITYWESGPDKGIYHAFNKGLAHATGNWIYFLGSDDYLIAPEVLERVAPHLKDAGQDTRIVYCRVAIVSPQGVILDYHGRHWEATKRKLYACMPICHQGIFHRYDLFQERGFFDESFRTSGDYELLLRELKDRRALFIPDVVVAGIRWGGKSTSPRSSLLVVEEEARARRKNGLPGYPLSCYWVAFKALARNRLSSMLGDRTFRQSADLYRRLSGRRSIWAKSR